MILEELKRKILLKARIRTISPKACANIANQINKNLNRHISPTTIKRIFGLASVKFQFSKYTLATLQEYADYEPYKYLTPDLSPDIFISDHLPYISNRNLKGNIKMGPVIAEEKFSHPPLKDNRCLHPEQLVFEAIRMMKEHNYEFLPVYEYGKPIGIVHLKDLVAFVNGNDQDNGLMYHKLNFDLRSALFAIKPSG